MTFSRLIAIITLLGTLATGAATVLADVNPKWAAIAGTVGTIVAALTERIQGSPYKG